MQAHGNAVFGFCLRELHDQTLAEDVAQQVFLEAFRDLDRFEHRSSERTWLLGIAHHRCLDAHKARQRRERRFESNETAITRSEAPGGGPFERLAMASQNAALEDCLAQLPLEMRAAVVIRYQTGCTFKQLAQGLGASADALQARVARAMFALRRCMESKGWTGE